MSAMFVLVKFPRLSLLAFGLGFLNEILTYNLEKLQNLVILKNKVCLSSHFSGFQKNISQESFKVFFLYVYHISLIFRYLIILITVVKRNIFLFSFFF